MRRAFGPFDIWRWFDRCFLCPEKPSDRTVKDAEQASIVRVLAPICADKFQHSADVGANLALLKKTDSWNRDELIEKAGWATFPGSEPDRKVAQACANLLSQTK
ncbi:MAG: hypothetical protein WA728_18065 [Xanthobacteraceae bacterium]